MTPAQRRTVVTEACTRRDLPVRRACRYLGIHRAVIRYVSRRTEPVDLVARLHDAATAKPRWGSPRLTWQLRREGWTVNHQRIERLVRVEDLRVGSHRRRKRTAQRRGPRPVPTRPDERWSMDLLTDTLAEGRPFRVGTLVDDATRECPVLLVDRSVPARRVIDGLEMALLLRGRHRRSRTIIQGVKYRRCGRFAARKAQPRKMPSKGKPFTRVSDGYFGPLAWADSTNRPT